jgi:hypothetical protein
MHIIFFSGGLHDLSTNQINPLDLAAQYGQISILDLILDYGLGKVIIAMHCQFF